MPSQEIVEPESIRLEGADGLSINVWDYGGTGQPLILAHCTGTHGRVWDPLVSWFLPHFHVYALDTRGHGNSDKPEDPSAYVWAYSGKDLLAVLDGLEITTPVATIGHSAGAAHICYAALERPKSFSRAVLIDPIIGPPEFFEGENPLAKKARRRKNHFAGREAARARYASKPPMEAWDSAVLDAYVTHGFESSPEGGVHLKCPGPIEAAVYEGSGATDIFFRLNELEMDVLLVTSENSNVRGLAELQKERIPGVRFEVIPEASHFIPQEKPREIAQLAVEFLTS